MNSHFLRQFFILTVDELKELFFRKRALFALILYAGTLILFFWGLSESRKMAGDFVLTLNLPLTQKELLKQSMESFLIPSQWALKFPIFKISLPLLIYFFISVSSLPFLIPMISCDMISLDLFRGTQRFLLFRVSRAAYFFSKTLAHFLLYFILQLVILVCIIIYCAYNEISVFNLFFIKSSLNLTLRVIPLIFLFVSFTQMISSQVKSPVKSLIINNFALLIMMILLAVKPYLSFFYKPLWSGLFSLQVKDVFFSMAGMSLWGGLFMLVSFSLFWRKKL